ncbi:thermoresistant glucokinase family carbohydrate kinase [Colletotrichum plurivorum]|uniref:gluconokinase n=1 Tax=Colletotrichum plurivorum TaxID=2175906 RepID=A0A8H6JVB9_9PEZI|nr:thermoresistant glucokinase family carbohydrate kinase [Colletotrichum plurivorum]
MSRQKKHIIFLTGPTGTGKTTIAKHLTESLHMTFVKGDDLHHNENVGKMHRGEPLTDENRWGWPPALRDEPIMDQDRDGNGGHHVFGLESDLWRRPTRCFSPSGILS